MHRTTTAAAALLCFGIGLLASQHLAQAQACSCTGAQLNLERADVELIDGEAGDEVAWRLEGYATENFGDYVLSFPSPQVASDIRFHLERVQ